jgi:hypothetical protein
MADTTIGSFSYERMVRLETTIARLRYVVIAVMVVMIAGFALLGVQVGRMNGRIDQLAAKVVGLDVSQGVKFDAANGEARRHPPAASCRIENDGSRDRGAD